MQLQPPDACAKISERADLPLPMAETTGHDSGRLNASAGHLSIHFEDQHPVEVPFMFDLQPSRTRWSMAVSFGINALLLAGRAHPADVVSAAHDRQRVSSREPERTHRLAERARARRGRRRRRQQDEGAAPGCRAAGQGQDHGSRREAAGADSEASGEGARARRTAEHPGGRCWAPRSETLPGAIDAGPALPTSSQGSGSGGGAGTGRGSASDRARVRVSGREPAAAPAAALTVRATASRRRCCCRK